MYDYRLWIDLAETAEEIDNGQLQAKIEELKALVRENLHCRPAECIHPVNFSWVFQCSAGANHRSTDHDRLLDVLRRLVEMLPGSHGLVYWTDDEVPGRQFFDGYHVLVIARGKIYERFDPFLSPLKPTVED